MLDKGEARLHVHHRSYRTYPTRALEVIADLTLLHLVIDRAAYEVSISKEVACNERMRSQRVWSSLNKHISSANIPSDGIIKKVS